MISGKKTKNKSDKLIQERVTERAKSLQEPELENHLSKHAMNYYRCLVDPRSHKAVRSICGGGGYNGMTGLAKVKAVGEVVVGTGKYGFVYFDPYGSGPFSDVPVAIVTTGAYTGTGSAVAGPGVALGLVDGINWSQAPYTAASLQDQTGTQLMYRCVAAAIYIRPTGGAVTQNGMINVLEVPGHPNFSGTQGALSLNAYISHPRCRQIRGIQTGGPSHNVLNVHPQNSQSFTFDPNNTLSNFKDGEDWRLPRAPTGSLLKNAGVIVLTGNGQTVYEVEIHGVYELKGAQVQSLRPSINDTLGYELIMNTLAKKAISGWEGHPSDAVAAYSAALQHTALETGPVKPALETKRETDWKTEAWESVKKYAPLVMDIAGFLL